MSEPGFEHHPTESARRDKGKKRQEKRSFIRNDDNGKKAAGDSSQDGFIVVNET